MTKFEKILDVFKTRGRYRALSLPCGIDLSSNDYLGFRNHAKLKAAALEAIENNIGLGAGGARLLGGNTPAHENLESFAAEHYGFERALYFANGYSANFALWSTLSDRHDVILYDSLMHACARDGFRASPAKSFKVKHNDINAYEDALKRYAPQAEQLWVCVESVYSMDGDTAPLMELYEMARHYNAILVIDEAHGTGVFGPQGQGLAHDVPRENLIVIHTCGKALGVAGGLVCANAAVIDYLINAARPFIFSTAPPPLQAYLTQKSIELCAGSEGDASRARLQILRDIAREHLGGTGTQIVPIILGSDESAVSFATDLQEKGFDIRAIRPPTVPEGTARLRLSLHADLEPSNLLKFISLLPPDLLKQSV